jgi:hypothetical protein
MDDAGAFSMAIERIEVSLDMCALWLRIALDHLDKSVEAHDQAIKASQVNDDQALGAALEAECVAGMLAIAAAAFALDAFYAALKDRSIRVARIPVSVGKRGSTRYRIIAEAMRREFRIGPQGMSNLRQALREVFRFRDYAVHPRGDFAIPVLKPEVNKLTEWRYVSFGAPSARGAVRAALAILEQIVERPRNPSRELATYLNGLQAELGPLAARWRARYGLLNDRD